MSEKIIEALDNRFSKHRLVFWYDENSDNMQSFESYQNKRVTKVIINNNEFALKHRILIEEPETSFLIYSPISRPSDKENWFLDLNMTECVFAADQTALRIEELEISQTYHPIVEKHIAFFQNENDRRLPFKKLLPKDADEHTFKLIMLSLICSTSKAERQIIKDFKEIIILLLENELEEKNKSFLSEIERFGLGDFLWETINSECGYKSDNPDFVTFAVYIFKSGLDFELARNHGTPAPNLRQVYSFIEYWRNNIQFAGSFKDTAAAYQLKLNAEHELSSLELSELVELDVFKITDNIIVNAISSGLVSDRLDSKKALEIISRRRESWWYRTTGEQLLVDNYLTLEYFLKFKMESSGISLTKLTIEEIWRQYQNTIYKVDTYYRKFMFHFNRTAGSVSLSPLIELIEKRYTNIFLKEIEDNWHNAVVASDLYTRFESFSQNHFFKMNVKPSITGKNQLFVIASDALRFEAGAELSDDLKRIKGLKVDLNPGLSVMPSITAYGMAVLLPHTKISITADGSFTVDGMAESGIENRNKILKKNLETMMPGKLGIVLKARDFMRKTKEEQMDDIKGWDVVYLFSDHIDSTADNAKTERALPEAVEEELLFINSLVRKLTATHGRRNVVITSDHGFMYQAGEVHESDMLSLDDTTELARKDRRWAYGTFPENPLYHKVKPSELGLFGDLDLRFPKGAFRIRKQGGGTRFVHGGISLQELMVPIIRVRQSREDDISMVEIISLITRTLITSNQHAVKLMQAEAVSGKVLPRTLMARFESEDGTVISDQHDLIFDTQSSSEQDRVRIIKLELTPEASRFNNKLIYLNLYTRIEGGETAFYRRHEYQLKKALEKDF